VYARTKQLLPEDEHEKICSYAHVHVLESKVQV